MRIHNLAKTSRIFSEKEEKEFNDLDHLIHELNNKDIPEGFAKKIDAKILCLNNLDGPNKHYARALKGARQEILKWLEKELKLVPKNYYAHTWTALGMSIFGLPIGTAIFAITDNSAFIAVGLPIGLGIGSLYGASLDKKAEAEGRVLKISH